MELEIELSTLFLKMCSMMFVEGVMEQSNKTCEMDSDESFSTLQCIVDVRKLLQMLLLLNGWNGKFDHCNTS